MPAQLTVIVFGVKTLALARQDTGGVPRAAAVTGDGSNVTFKAFTLWVVSLEAPL